MREPARERDGRAALRLLRFPPHARILGGRRWRHRLGTLLGDLGRERAGGSVLREDATGKVRVHPQGSEVDAQRVVDRFEPSANPGFALGGVQVLFEEDDDTLGYRYTESVLPVDAPVYVLGVVREDGDIGASATPVDAPVEALPLVGGGGLEMNLPSPRDRERRFVISHRSEEALGRELARTTFWMGVGAIGALTLAVILTVVSFIVAAD